MTDQWRPIESAPKDGTEILGWREDAGRLLIRWTAPIHFMTTEELDATVTGEDDWQNQEDWFHADFCQGGRLDGSETPTHWTPLPDEPNLQEWRMKTDMPPLPLKVIIDRHIPTGIALYGYTDSMVRAYAREYANSQVREVLEALGELLSFKNKLDVAMAEQKASTILANYKGQG